MKAITAGLSIGLILASCGDPNMKDAATRIVPVTIVSGGANHVFRAELAQTTAEQARGLMLRTDLSPDSAMLFAPYPPEGGPAREASFWMKNTPSALDIIFIRSDGSIARIAENTIPFSEAPVASGEPITAVLEVPGGRAAELGIGEGDMVRWPVSATASAGPAR